MTVKRTAVLFVVIALLFGCSSRPSDGEIEKLLFGANDDPILKYEKFVKIDAFQKDDRTYIADVKYNIVFKMSRKEIEEALKKDGNIIANIAIGMAMFVQFGDYDKGATYAVTKKVTLIRKESGWNIDKIEDGTIERIVTKEEEEAKALQAKKEAELRRQQEEREEARRKALAEAKALDDKEWSKAQQAGTEEAYRAYLSNNPQGGHLGEANQVLDNIAWDAASNENSIESYGKYLQSSAKGQHRAEAARIIEDMRDHVVNLYEVPELTWTMVLGLRAKTFFSDRPVLDSMRDAYIAFEDCNAWCAVQNEIQKGMVQNRAVSNIGKGELPTRVRFSSMMVLNSYDHKRQAFVIGRCGYTGGGIDLKRSITASSLPQPPAACSRLATSTKELHIEIERPLSSESFLPMEPQKAEKLLERISGSKEMCRSSGTLAVIPMEFVANVRPYNTGNYGALYASLIAAYAWTDSSKSELIAILGNASNDSVAHHASAVSARTEGSASSFSPDPMNSSSPLTAPIPSAIPGRSESPGVSSSAPVFQGAPSQKSFQDVDNAVRNFFGFVQAKQVERAILAYSASKRPNLKRNLLESVARETEYYRIERIEPQKLEASRATVLVYTYHKKVKSPEEYWQIEIDLVNEQGEWKILSTPGKKLK